MTTNTSRWVGMAMLCCANAAPAYDENATHPVLTGAAARASDLNHARPLVLENFGLAGGIHEPRWFALDPVLGFGGLSIVSLIMMGATAEDHEITGEPLLNPSRFRVFRHFFDPQNGGRGLTKALVPLGESSIEWSLETDVDLRLQEFSYSDAKESLMHALVGVTEHERDASMRRMFVTLGHVVHHIQDMAQPQHVRNEDHCQSAGCALLLRYRPSSYERYTAGKGRAILVDGYDPVDSGTFSTPVQFWQKDRMGVAEFTSLNFVGSRTNFRGTLSDILPAADYDQPNGGGIIVEKVQAAELLGPNQALSGEMWFVGRAIPDQYRPTKTTLNERLSTFSIFETDLREFDAGLVQTFVLNRFNYDSAHTTLLPRAVGYSAGLINYFFRGRIGIGLPEEGVYGIIDHATTNAAGQGYGKLKLKLHNASPDGVKPSNEAVPQTMQGGTLVAVAKYTLNSCYQADLSGDFAVRIDTGEVINPAFCSLDQYFAGEEQISQSAAILAASLEKEPADFEFDFSSQPIPVNARDLRIQVVYTGQLGAEADGIAFGGRDISEPTHLMIYNNTDYYAVDGTFHTPEQIRADEALSSRVKGLDIDPDALTGLTLAVAPDRPLTEASGPVPVNGYVRATVLADIDQPFSLSVRADFERGGSADATFPGIWANVTDLRGDPIFITALAIYRGPRTHLVDVVYKANNAVPLADDALTVMSGRDAGDPGPTPIPLRF